MMPLRLTADFSLRLWLSCLTILAALVYAGCNSGSATTSDPPTAAEQTDGSVADAGGKSTADDVLDRMIAAYQSAESYRDNAVLRYTMPGPDGTSEYKIPVRVVFQRPNRLQCELGPVRITSDGEKIYGSGEMFPGQVVMVAAPKTLHAETFFNTESLQPLFVETQGPPIQLDLLAASRPLKSLRTGSQPPVLLEPQDLDGAKCDRVVFRDGEDEFRMWIDRKTHLLRRVDYPFDPSQTVTLEIADAELNTKFDAAAFQWEASEGPALVRYFAPPPDPQYQPCPLLGKTIQPFTLAGSDGEAIHSDTFRGKVTVLDVWDIEHGPCRKSIPKFDTLAKKYRDAQDVQFLAVSVDPAEVGNDAIAEALANIGSDVPWARSNLDDPDSNIFMRCGVTMIPLYVMIGKDGRLEMLRMDADIDPELLSGYVDQLLDGKSTYQRSAKEAAERWEQMLKQYDEQIQAARVDGGYSKTVEIQRAEIAEASQPDLFQLTELWRTTDVKSPGNLLAVDSNGQRQIVVIDESRNVATLDAQGNVIARHDDLIPKQAVITFLRTASGGEGKRFYLAGAPWQKSLYLLDDEFKQLLKYPDFDTAEISDAVLADLDGAGAPQLCIAYVAEAGVHGVSLQGNRIWRNRSISHVSDLAVSSPNQDGQRQIVCTHALGSLAVIDHEGRDLPPLQVRNRSLTNVVRADLAGDGEDELCAIAVGLEGEQRTLLGLSIDGIADWESELPGGYHDSAIEPITSGKLTEAEPAYWLYAASDGSIHMYSADGKTRDHFNTGHKLTGLAATTINGKPAIIAAGENGITAWAIEKK